MSFLLTSQNIFEYSIEKKLLQPQQQQASRVELKLAKNFNLLLSLPEGNKILVKQERHNSEGKTAGEFLNEWRVQELLKCFSELNQLRFWLPEVLHFDAENSIIIFKYLNDYRDLADFYLKENSFPLEIATIIGNIIAHIHRLTWNRQEYHQVLSNENTKEKPNFLQGLERITPEIFGAVPADALKFFVLYQKYDSLGQAIAQLPAAYNPCCLTHNDLKLNNILLHNNWQENEKLNNSIIRMIDWERSAWGDPAFDLGTLIASYLQIWLSSLVVSKNIEIEQALKLAATPLEKLQPSMAALTTAYLSSFPEIIEQRPDFLKIVLQFAGFALIQQIQAMIQYQKSFNNTGICFLQVAKSLLCHPEQSISTVFGITEDHLLPFSCVAK